MNRSVHRHRTRQHTRSNTTKMSAAFLAVRSQNSIEQRHLLAEKGSCTRTAPPRLLETGGCRRRNYHKRSRKHSKFDCYDRERSTEHSVDRQPVTAEETETLPNISIDAVTLYFFFVHLKTRYSRNLIIT